MLTFIFNLRVVGYTCCMKSVFRREGKVAVNDGSRHGDAVFGWNLYGDSCRLRYRTGVLPENYLLSELYTGLL